MADDYTPAKPSAPSADASSVREYAEKHKLRSWQIALLKQHYGDKIVSASEMTATLEKLSKERI